MFVFNRHKLLYFIFITINTYWAEIGGFKYYASQFEAGLFYYFFLINN